MKENIKCKICNKDVSLGSHFIDDNFYHNSCIERLIKCSSKVENYYYEILAQAEASGKSVPDECVKMFNLLKGYQNK